MKVPKQIISLAVGLLVTVLFFTGCENDHSLDPQIYGRVYMPQALNNPVERPLNYADSVQSLYYNANLGGPSTIGNSIPLSFKVDSALVDSFNVNHGTTYKIMPSSSYELTTTSQMIPAGQESTPMSKVNIITKGNIPKNTDHYLLPVTMTVEGGPIQINEELQTTYFVISLASEQENPGNESYPIFDRSYWSISGFSSEDEQQPASNVLDGDPNSLWQGRFRGGPNAPLPHSVSINMYQPHTVYGVKIIPKHANAKSLPTEIKVEFSNDGETWANSQTFNNPWSYDNFEVKRLPLDKPVTAQYIKVTIVKDGGDVPVTGLAEVYTYGELPLIDRADWTIHGFSSEDEQQPASNILDGDPNTLWQGRFRGGPNAPLPHSVSVNMGRAYVLHGFKINPKHANAKSLPTEIKLEFSDDGETWKNSITLNNPWTFENFEVKRIALDKPVEAQYFRIIIVKDGGDVPVTGLNEVYAY